MKKIIHSKNILHYTYFTDKFDLTQHAQRWCVSKLSSRDCKRLKVKNIAFNDNSEKKYSKENLRPH